MKKKHKKGIPILLTKEGELLNRLFNKKPFPKMLIVGKSKNGMSFVLDSFIKRWQWAGHKVLTLNDQKDQIKPKKRLARSQKLYIDELSLKGYLFTKESMRQLRFRINRLRKHGYLIRIFNYRNARCGDGCRYKSFKVVFLEGKERAVLKEIYKRWPNIKGKPNSVRKFETPILRNLHTQATECTKRRLLKAKEKQKG